MDKQGIQPGYRSGRITVISEAPRRNGRRHWFCRCECGNECVVSDSHLKSGHTKSCGCLSRKHPDYEPGIKIGQLTLRKELPRKNGDRRWLCRCECGNECEVQETHLKSGHTKSCGCLSVKLCRERAATLSGQRFERLIALEPTDLRRRNSVIWRCRCDCGNEAYVGSEQLLSGKTRSCGCLRSDQRMQNFQKAIHHVDGTCIEKIARPKETAANTSGHRGVYPLKNGRYRASITFQGKRYDLGTHGTFEEAAEARLKGEQLYFEEYLEGYYAKQNKLDS